jgi:hypothetical protein
LVPLAGLEPARFSSPDFESGASTNSATGAFLRRSGADHSGAKARVNGNRRQTFKAWIWALSGPPQGAYDPPKSTIKEPAMNEEALNMSLRKFLKVVGVTSQQEIEKTIRAAVADGRLKGNETVQAQMVLTIGKIGLTHKVDGAIELA